MLLAGEPLLVVKQSEVEHDPRLRGCRRSYLVAVVLEAAIQFYGI